VELQISAENLQRILQDFCSRFATEFAEFLRWFSLKPATAGVSLAKLASPYTGERKQPMGQHTPQPLQSLRNRRDFCAC
jgi:hypothetical protein